MDPLGYKDPKLKFTSQFYCKMFGMFSKYLLPQVVKRKCRGPRKAGKPDTVYRQGNTGQVRRFKLFKKKKRKRKR